MSAEPKGIILIVDDSADTLGWLNEALTAEGYTIFVAMDGQQAMTIATKMQPDLILLDAVMPHMDGFEVCRLLKRDEDLGDIPVIFMTGLNDTDSIVKGLESGSVDYICKPIDIEVLYARIKVHLNNSRLAKSAKSALNEIGQYAFMCDVNGNILWATASAKSLLLSMATSEHWVKDEFTNLLKHWLSRHPDKYSTMGITEIGSSVRVSFLSRPNPNEFLCRFQDNDEQTVRKLLKKQFSLTERESEVLFWLAQGKTNKEIAEILSMSPRTVNKHLEPVFRKLLVENRTSAAAICHQYLNSL